MDSQSLQPITKQAHRKINIRECFRLRQHGTPLQTLADRYNCSKSAVSKAMKPFTCEKTDLETFKEQRADLLAGKQRELLAALTVDKAKDMNGRDLAVSFGILFDKERLERGQATSNVAIMIQAIEAACKGE